METPAAIDGLLAEAEEFTQRSWFAQDFEVSDRTDTTITLHFFIDAHLFVQVFFSQRSERLSLALIGPAGRLYGWDRENGSWHRHPFGQSEDHKLMPEGAPVHPLPQFMASVEELLVNHGLV